MADSFVSKLITELTAKTTAADTDLVPIADSNGNYFKMTWQKMKQLLLGTKDISGVGDGTVTGAISELNTKLIYETTVVNPNSDYYALRKKEGYCLINAYNGDRDANSISITSIQKQGSNYILFFQQKVTTNIRIEVVWVKTSYWS